MSKCTLNIIWFSIIFQELYLIDFYRLGLGAKVSRQSNTGLSNDPIERKLNAKLDAGKRKSAISMKESTKSAKRGSDNIDDSDEDLESRTKSFIKNRVVPPTLSLQRNKKQK